MTMIYDLVSTPTFLLLVVESDPVLEVGVDNLIESSLLLRRGHLCQVAALGPAVLRKKSDGLGVNWAAKPTSTFNCPNTPGAVPATMSIVYSCNDVTDVTS